MTAGSFQSDEEAWVEISDLIDSARDFYRDNKYEEAIEVYRKILEFGQLDYTDRAGLLSELGYCYHELALYDLSIKTLLMVEELTEEFENKSGLYRVLGANYFAIGNYSNALKYQELAFKFSENPEEKKILQFQLGRTYLFLGNSKLSKKFFIRYLETLPDGVSEDRKDVMYNMGFTYLLMGKYSKAKECFQYLIDNKNNDEDLTRGFFGLTELYYQRKEFSQVKRLTEMILDISSQFSRIEKVYYYRILAYASEKQMSTVTKLANEFLIRFPESEYKEKVEQLLA